eukprot:gene3130-4036_t
MAAAAGVALALLAGAGAAQARDVNWSIGVNSPGVSVGVSNGYGYGYPAYVAPAPVYVAPRPIYYAPPPPPPAVYYAPPAPVYYAPPPGYYYREGHRHHRAGGAQPLVGLVPLSPGSPRRLFALLQGFGRLLNALCIAYARAYEQSGVRMMLAVAPLLCVDEQEVEFSAMRAQGAGGQNVNKVSSAVHLRFDVPASSLPEPVKERLLALRDTRITQEGVVVIKAQQFRSQEQNRADALVRLNALCKRA